MTTSFEIEFCCSEWGFIHRFTAALALAASSMADKKNPENPPKQGTPDWVGE